MCLAEKADKHNTRGPPCMQTLEVKQPWSVSQSPDAGLSVTEQLLITQLNYKHSQNSTLQYIPQTTCHSTLTIQIFHFLLLFFPIDRRSINFSNSEVTVSTMHAYILYQAYQCLKKSMTRISIKKF